MADESKPEMTFNEVVSEVAERQATAIGQIAISWNSLHELLGNSFAMLVSPGYERYGWATWHSLMDRNQRGALAAVIEVKQEERAENKQDHDPVLVELAWLLNRIKPGERNMGIHTPIAMIIEDGIVKYVPSHWGGHPYALKLKDKDLVAEMQTYHARILDAIKFASALKNLIADDKHGPLPPKPQSLMTDKEWGADPRNPRNAGKAPQPQPQSSGE